MSEPDAPGTRSVDVDAGVSVDHGAPDVRGAGAALLSPALLHALQPLELRARIVADALYAGGHRSRRFGSSSEFAEHKAYAPGDDLRRLDWKVMARQNRSYVRRTEDETRVDVVVVVDTSHSMAYAGGARGVDTTSKIECARTLAAAIAYVAQHRADAPGLSLFAGDETAFLPPRGTGDTLGHICAALVRAEANGKASLERVLERVCERQKRKAVVVVVSDFIDSSIDELWPLGVLRKRGGEAVLLQVLHEDEVDFPFDGVVKFEDLEGDREVQVDAPLVRASYLQELAAFLRTVEGAAADNDARYTLCRTDEPPHAALSRVFSDGNERRG
jgi:uncharacterized protein (DUF58 family)